MKAQAPKFDDGDCRQPSTAARIRPQAACYSENISSSTSHPRQVYVVAMFETSKLRIVIQALALLPCAAPSAPPHCSEAIALVVPLEGFN